MKILVIDIGGTNVKMLVTGQSEPRRFPSGRELTPQRMIDAVRETTKDWEYEAVSIGFPGPILCEQPIMEPVNLGPGWMGFDFQRAFGLPAKVINDAAMQALGSYNGGKMLFLGLGTGVGAAVIMNCEIHALELGRFRYRKHTLEHYLGERGRKRYGLKKWRRRVHHVIEQLTGALHPDDTVIGGGNARRLVDLPPGTRAGSNANAFLGGFRMWEDAIRQT